MDEADDFAEPGEKRILVVDDDAGQLDFLGFMLEKEGFLVDTAADGTRAWSKVQASPPDLIVLDLMLPSPGGYEVLRRLQAEGFGSIPVVVVSAKAMDSKAIAILKEEPNVREFVPKPPPQAGFAAKLHQLLRTRPRTAKGAC